jgi:PPOX class probable FMN-dependent enzyme
MSTETYAANRFQEAFGLPSARARTKVVDSLSAELQGFILESPFMILATSDASGRCDASPRGGKPGFVKILDDRHLLLPDVAGNRLFQSYQNIDANPRVGLLFMIPGNDRTVRVNGNATVVDREELERRRMTLSVHEPDDNAKNLQGLLIAVEEAYGHCPRAFKFSQLWDTETITRNRETQR